MGILAIVLIVVVLIVWWNLSNRRTRAIYLTGLPPEERAAHLRAEEQAKPKPITRKELIGAAVLLPVVILIILLIAVLVGANF